MLYFKEHAADWKSRAASRDQQRVNIVEQRNAFVRCVVKRRATTHSMLDVGCGTGDLVCDFARLGVDSTGVDFAEEMIHIARAKAKKQKLWKAHFHCASVFDFDLAKKRYDVISANGFIEYISLNELDRFLDLAHEALSPGGSFVVGSRNRLFNIFSINSFTSKEMKAGTVRLLLSEAVAIASGMRPEKLGSIRTAELQKEGSKHIRTGIEVSTRYQFTPAQLIKMLKRRGFVIRQIYPIHVHGVPPSFKDLHREVHTSISNLLQNYADEGSALVPYASSFMLHADREAD